MRSTILLAAGLVTASHPAAAQLQLTPRDSALHALNRLAYGPAPGQLDSLARGGVMRWIDGQLAAPVPDPSLVRLEGRFDLLKQSPAELAELFQQARRERSASADTTMSAAPLTPTQRNLRRLLVESGQLAVARATVADHQLAEVMTDFWVNHFNVFAGKGIDRYLLPSYVEQTIRPRALGRFRDLLIATAESPAMLFYLDNALSVAPGAVPPGRGRAMAGIAPPRRPNGINENYARELLELHTLGVDGGYTQHDVVDVARILTGWGIERPLQGGGFRFNQWAHDTGPKVVLGVTYPAGHGQDEGLRLLDLLSRSSATIHHVSGQLCARFVSDTHSDGCEDAAVAAWKRTDGDIREVLRAIFTAPDFWAPAVVGSKVKTPLEFVVSAARVLAAQPDTTPRLAQVVGRLGQPLYLQSSPAGYPERQDAWVNSGALLSRMNTAVAMADGRLAGLTVNLDVIAPVGLAPDSLLVLLDRRVLGGGMTANTRAVLRGEILSAPDPATARARAVGLTLGSPEFQRQ